MKSIKMIVLTACMLLGQMTQAQDFEFKADQIQIPHEKFILPNGLTLLVHEDHKAPIVAVNVWYHVGSKNEKSGKSGFAHLFEHLMFNGSENYDFDYFKAIESIGGTDTNGTTNADRTNYFQNVPVSALETVLFLESDRMGHLLGVIDQDLLDEQRGVVQNEKRQGENNPYGRQYNLLTKAMFPKGHPYSWTVIGEMEDLNAATLDDVHEWFKSYYGAANAVISIAGDITPNEAYQKVSKYFGHIPSGPTIVRPEKNIPILTQDTYTTYEDRVPEARVLFAWSSPEFGSREDLHFDLIAAVLSNGKNSRLYKKFVYTDKTASYVSAYQSSREIASNFIVSANVVPNGDAKMMEQQLNAEIEKFIENGPTEDELKRVKANYFANFIKGLERIGGFGGKSDILASNQTYHGDANYYKTQLKYIEDATVEDLKATAQKWLKHPKHTLVCLPFAEHSVSESTVDRSKLPELTAQKKSSFPAVEKTKLSNGLNVVLARRSDVSTVVMELMVDAGYKTDILGKAGTASLAMNLLDEGTKTKNSLKINEELQLLGASLSTYSDPDYSNVYMNTLIPSLDQSIELFADVVLNPVFPESEFERLKQEQINDIRSEKAQPFGMVLRGMNKYLYGENHPYSNPFTGTGYETTVEEITRDDMLKFYNSWMKPNNATIIVTGDVDLQDLKNKLEKSFGKWKRGNVPTISFPPAKPNTNNTLYVVDRPESQSSVIVAGHLTTKYGEESEIAIQNMMNILGGDFTSRINMNLREDKHWSYGAGGLIFENKQERPLVVYGMVQTDKTAESIVEFKKELNDFISTRPVTEEELEKVKTNEVLKLPGLWETNGSVNNSLYNLVKYDLPDDYYNTYDASVRNLSTAQINQLSRKVVNPSKVNWFVAGDKEIIIDKLSNLDFDQIVELDADGNPKKAEIKIPEKEIKQ